MGVRANVQSIEPLRYMRLSMLKFGEACSTALGDAESDVQRTLNWLETEARSYWQGQLTKRQAHVTHCQEAVRMKKLFKDSTGKPQSAVEEEKALKIAQRAHEEAIRKIQAVHKYTGVLRKESETFRSVIQRLATMVEQDVPTAAAKLDGYVMQIEQYAALEAPDSGLPSAQEDYQSAGGIDPAESGQMTRATDPAPPTPAPSPSAIKPEDAETAAATDESSPVPAPDGSPAAEDHPPEGEAHGRA